MNLLINAAGQIALHTETAITSDGAGGWVTAGQAFPAPSGALTQVQNVTLPADFATKLYTYVAGAFVDATPGPSLAEQKKTKAAAAVTQYEARLAAGLTHDGHTWQIDEASQGRIGNMAALALSYRNGDGTWNEVGWSSHWQPAGGFSFISVANVLVPRSAQQMFALGRAASLRVARLRYRIRDLKTDIAAAADRTALDAIDGTAGWPA